MNKTSSRTQAVTLYVGTYGYGVTCDFIARRNENLQDNFRAMLFDNPFIQLLGVPNGFVMGYGDWTHARHVTNINGCKRHCISLLKVELSADAFARLQSEGHIKNVAKAPKLICQVNPFELLKVADSEVAYTVLAPTNYAAVTLDEFKLPEALVAELKSARTDCLQSLIVELATNQPAYEERFAAHSLDFGEFFKKMTARARELPAKEILALLELL